MKIQNTTYTNNNYLIKSDKRLHSHTTSFGNLIVEKGYIPTEIREAILNSKELKKLVKLFNNKGRDIHINYESCLGRDYEDLGIFVHKKGDIWSEEMADYFMVKGDDIDGGIVRCIKTLKDDYAEKTYNKYFSEKSKQENELNSSERPSFWKRLFGKK